MEINWIVVIVAIIVIILFIAILVIWWLTYRVLFQPTTDHIWYPNIPFSNVFLPISTESVPEDAIIFESNQPVVLPNSNMSFIHSWWFKNFGGNKIVIFFHGNNGNISYREYVIEICQKLGLNLFLPDYRGYGLSSGIATLDNIKTDAEKIYAFVRKYYDPNDIIIWGESLGGTPALKVASSYPCHKLVLFATFASIEDVIWSHYPTGLMKILGYGVKATMTPMPNKTYIKSVTCPIIILHSKDDDRIPYINAEILANNVSHGNIEIVSFCGSHGCPTFKYDSLPKLAKFLGIEEKCYKQVDWECIFDKIDAKILPEVIAISG